MTAFSNARHRLVDRLAVAAVGGAVIGVIALLALAPLPGESEWQRLIGAAMLASPAPAADSSSLPAEADRHPSVM